MEAAMFKEALICGIGMICDLSGSSYSRSQNAMLETNDGIASDWKQVGVLLANSIKVERPKIEAEASRQLLLKLG
jgi:hypothetical protein